MSIRTFTTVSLLAGLLAAARLAAGTPSATDISLEPDAGVTIRITPIAEHWSGEGFMPVAVHVENRSSRAREWTLRFSTDRGYTGETVQQDAVVGAEASRRCRP